MIMSEKTLYDSLYRACMDNPWSPDHKQIAGLLLGAKRFVVSEALALDLDSELEERPHTIETNIDLASWPTEPTWFEWPLAATIIQKPGVGAATGVLICPHPDFPGLFMAVSAWRRDDEQLANHSYASAIIDVNLLDQNAHDVRSGGHSLAAPDSIRRLLDLISVTITQDFQDELLIKFKQNEQVIGEALKSASGEIPFLLGLLVVVSQPDLVSRNTFDDHVFLERAPQTEPGLIEKLKSKLVSPQKGLIRQARWGAPKLVWRSHSEPDTSPAHAHEVGDDIG